MREAVSEWTLIASDFLMGLVESALPLVFAVLLALVMFRGTRPLGGNLMFNFSYLLGVATWFYGAAVSFATFGWLGLILGLLVVGVGVVPLGIIGGFMYLDSSIAWQIIGLSVATFALRRIGILLMAPVLRQSPDPDNEERHPIP